MPTLFPPGTRGDGSKCIYTRKNSHENTEIKKGNVWCGWVVLDIKTYHEALINETDQMEI